jgi:hypothetical protein
MGCASRSWEAPCWPEDRTPYPASLTITYSLLLRFYQSAWTNHCGQRFPDFRQIICRPSDRCQRFTSTAFLPKPPLVMSPLPSKQFARRLQEIFRNVHFFSICPRFCWAPLSIADDLPIARPYAVAPKTGLAPGMDARCLMKKGTGSTTCRIFGASTSDCGACPLFHQARSGACPVFSK